MKKRLVLTLATSAILILAGCGGTPTVSASVSSTPIVTSSQPTTSSTPTTTSVPESTSSETVITAMSISNKDALKAAWHVADADRQLTFSITPEANIAQLILDGRLVVASSDATVVSVNGQYLTALKEGTATITATIGTITDSVELTVLASEKDYALTSLADVIKDGVTLGAHSYVTQVKVKSWLSGKTDGTAYGNLMATDSAGANEIKVYGLTATSSALSYDAAKKVFTFTNPKDFLTNDDTKAIKADDILTLVVIRCDYGTTKEIEGVVVDINGKAVSNGGTSAAPVTTDAVLADVPALGLYSYVVKGKITAWKDAASTDGTKYGNFFIKSDGATGDAVYVYGASATGALGFDATKAALKFTNPQDFLTNDYTKTLAIGSDVTILATRCDYTNASTGKTTKEITGIVLVPSVTVDPVIADVTIADLNKKTATDATVVKVSGLFDSITDNAAGNGYLVNPTTGDAIAIYGSTKTAANLVKTDSGKGYYTGVWSKATDFATNGVVAGSYVTMEVVFTLFGTTPEISGVITSAVAPTDAAYTYKFAASAAAAENGTVVLGKTADIAFGETITVTATPASGYKIDTVSLSHGYSKANLTDNSGYSFTAQAVNVVTVTFVSATAVVSELTLTVDSLAQPSGNYTASNVQTISGVSITAANVGNYGNGLQYRTKNGAWSSIFNTTATPSSIKSITVTEGATVMPSGKQLLTISAGAAAITASVDADVITADGTNKVHTVNYTAAQAVTFFNVGHHSTNSGAIYIASIVVELYVA